MISLCLSEICTCSANMTIKETKEYIIWMLPNYHMPTIVTQMFQHLKIASQGHYML